MLLNEPKDERIAMQLRLDKIFIFTIKRLKCETGFLWAESIDFTEVIFHFKRLPPL